MKLLEVAEGRCAQDDFAIKKLSELPGFVKARITRNVIECSTLSEGRILVFFADGIVRKVSLSKFKNLDGIDSVLNNEKLYRSCKVGTGGYYITFNDSIDIPASELYKSGEEIPLTLDDFKTFIQNNVLDTSESCSLLECSRQNIAYMVKQNQLTPVKEEVKGNIYLKGEVLKNTW